MRHRGATVALGGDDGLHTRAGELVPDRVGVVPLVGQERCDPVGDHEHERPEALRVVRLARRYNESEGAALGVAAGVELGGEAAA